MGDGASQCADHIARLSRAGREPDAGLYLHVDLAASSAAIVAPIRLSGEQRKLLGAWYTPDRVAAAMVRWALSAGPGRVLDPSFGDGAFLQAATEYAGERWGDIGDFVGVDIEPGLLTGGQLRSRSHQWKAVRADFLTLCPEDLQGSFRYIIGNPPYVRHHHITDAQAKSATRAAHGCSTRISRTSGLWAYFVLHALRFLEPQGKLALILPQASLSAGYAAPVRRHLQTHFRSVVWIELRERIFEGTDEVAVVLFASQDGPPGEVTLRFGGVDHLDAWVDGRSNAQDDAPPPKITNLLQNFAELGAGQRFSELATVRIGVVTGANRHFLCSATVADAMGLPAAISRPCVSASRQLVGLAFSEKDGEKQSQTPERTRLLCVPEGPPPDAIADWILKGEARNFDQRFKCRVRKDWFRLTPSHPPPAFATCASSRGPTLILNEAKWHCTNTLHEIRWKPGKETFSCGVAAAVQTSWVQLQAEVLGRVYGGGVLKVDPGTWERLLLPSVLELPRASFQQIDALLRRKEREKARRLADEVLLIRGMGIAPSTLERVSKALQAARDWRHPGSARTRPPPTKETENE